MNSTRRTVFFAACLAALLAAALAPPAAAQQHAQPLSFLIQMMDRFHRTFDVYTGGFEGPDGASRPVCWKSTEHNIDLYVAFSRLHAATGDARWASSAEHAKRFFLAMWDSHGRKFLTGTTCGDVPETRNRSVVPLDAQTWAILALRDEAAPYLGALDFADRFHRIAPGLYDFNTDKDGAWYEGGAQMAAAFQQTGQPARAAPCLTAQRAVRYASGGIPAASRDGLTTGFNWLYFRRPHTGATAWLTFAELGVNPFWIGVP